MHFLSGALIDLDATILIQIVVFFAAFFILRALVFKPIMNVFEARETAIDGEREEARRMEREAKEKADKFEDEMHRVRRQAAEERERLRQEGLQMERQLLSRVQGETDKQLEEADNKLRSEAEKVRKEMDSSVPQLARQIASKLLDREVK